MTSTPTPAQLTAAFKRGASTAARYAVSHREIDECFTACDAFEQGTESSGYRSIEEVNAFDDGYSSVLP